jgi:hypothetical protein
MTPSLGKMLYLLLVVDAFSKYSKTMFTKTKKEPSPLFEKAKQHFETLSATTPIILQPGTIVFTDNQFLSGPMTVWTAKYGFVQQASPPHTPQLNPIPESAIRILRIRTITLLYIADLPAEFWCLAWAHAEALQNHLPMSHAPYNIPIEVFTNSKLTEHKIQQLAAMPIFGSTAVVHNATPGPKGDFQPKGILRVMVGFNFTNNSYVVYDKTTNRISNTVHVKFHDPVFPREVPRGLSTTPSTAIELDVLLFGDAMLPLPLVSTPVTVSAAPPCAAPPAVTVGAPSIPVMRGTTRIRVSSPTVSAPSTVGTSAPRATGPVAVPPPTTTTMSAGNGTQLCSNMESAPVASAPAPRVTGTRVSSGSMASGPPPPTPTYMETVYSQTGQGTFRSTVGEETDEDILLNAIFAGVSKKHEHMSLAEACFLAQSSVGQDDEPRSIAQAMQSLYAAEWKEATRDQIDKMLKYQCIDFINVSDVPKGERMLPSSIPYKYKYNKANEVIRFKARLVIGGHREKPGDTYFPGMTYAPVASAQLVRIIMAYATGQGWHQWQGDVTTAFMQSTPRDAPFYAHNPPALEQMFPQYAGMCMRVYKSLNGMHDGSKDWFQTLHGILISKCNMIQAKAEPTLYLSGLGTPNVRIATIIVDDLYIVSPLLASIKQFEQLLNSAVDTTPFEPLHLFNGWEVEYDMASKTMYLSLTGAILRFLKTWNMLNCKPKDTPMSTTINMWKDKDTLPILPEFRFKVYQIKVGTILYFSITLRPDLVVSVNACAQFMSCPNEIHEQALEHIMHYLKGTYNLALCFRAPADSTMLHAMQTSADASHWAPDGKSNWGVVTMMNGGPVTFQGKKMSCVPLSTGEGELVAGSHAGRIMVYETAVREAMGAPLALPRILQQDSTAAIAMENNYMSTSMTKHIRVKYLFLRDLVLRKEVNVVYCPTAELLADFFTKPLDRVTFLYFRDQMMVVLPDAILAKRNIPNMDVIASKKKKAVTFSPNVLGAHPTTQ